MAVAITAVSNLLSSLLQARLPPPTPIRISPFLPESLPLPKTTPPGWAPLVATKGSSGDDDDDDDIKSVAWPSLANANILFFFNVHIDVDDEEPEEKIVRRFRNAVLRAGVIQESKRRRFFENTQEKRKRKARSAAQRNRKRRLQPRIPAKQEAPANKKDDDDDDNYYWEVPEGDIPYCR